MFGEASGFLFAPDLFIVRIHVEDAAGAFDELGGDVELLLNGFRQTGGAREVVSLRTVFDGDIHEPLLLEFRLPNSECGNDERRISDCRSLMLQRHSIRRTSSVVSEPLIFWIGGFECLHGGAVEVLLATMSTHVRHYRLAQALAKLQGHALPRHAPGTAHRADCQLRPNPRSWRFSPR